ncbi:MAG: hypothetical protein RI894_1646 [Bacteroidota bacterium]|jgi:hypothetical protein
MRKKHSSHSPFLPYFALAASLLFSLFLSSCSVLEIGTDVQANLARTSSINCNGAQTHVNLFFEGENTDFNYQTIGYVQITGNERVSNDELLQELKYQAWNGCANAIINVKISYKTREVYMLGQDYSKNPPRYYSAPVISGVAIHLADRDLPANAFHGVDTSFLRLHRDKEALAQKNLEGETNVAVITGILSAVVTGIALSSRKQ